MKKYITLCENNNENIKKKEFKNHILHEEAKG